MNTLKTLVLLAGWLVVVPCVRSEEGDFPVSLSLRPVIGAVSSGGGSGALLGLSAVATMGEERNHELALELTYASLGLGGSSGQDTVSVTPILGTYRYRFGDGRFQPFLSVVAGATRVSGSGVGGDSSTAFTWGGGAGVRASVGSRFDLEAGYRYQSLSGQNTASSTVNLSGMNVFYASAGFRF